MRELLPPKREDLPEEEDVVVDDVHVASADLSDFGANDRMRAPEEDTYDNPGGEPNVQCAPQ